MASLTAMDLRDGDNKTDFDGDRLQDPQKEILLLDE
jgi:hypothetical protein